LRISSPSAVLRIGQQNQVFHTQQQTRMTFTQQGAELTNDDHGQRDRYTMMETTRLVFEAEWLDPNSGEDQVLITVSHTWGGGKSGGSSQKRVARALL
jgi:hypothetical protein